MADDPNERGPQDRSRVHLSQDHEVRYWTKHFGVSEEQLKDAVKKVGSSSSRSTSGSSISAAEFRGPLQKPK